MKRARRPSRSTVRNISGRKMNARQMSRAAFTLMEVMLVLVIIAAIAGIAVMNLGNFQKRALENKTRAEIGVIKNALKSYKLEMFTYPEELNALYEKPSGLVDESKWFQVMEEPIEGDAWGNPYEYETDGKTFTIRSVGEDGQSGTEDDIT